MIEILESRRLLTAPALSNLEALAYGYAASAPATPISSAVTVADANSATLVGASVQIDANYANGEDTYSRLPIRRPSPATGTAPREHSL